MNCRWVSKENRNVKCTRKADSSGYCLFHKENKSPRQIALFEAYIKKGEINDFTGFCFNENFNIEKIVNYKYDKLKFCEAKFKKEANFNDFIFVKSVDFTNVEFKSSVNFNNCIFLNNRIFNKTIFNEKYINEKVFEKANFNGQKLIVEKCAYFPRLDGVVFSPYTKFILKDINYSKKNCLCGKNNYKIARIQAKQTEDNENMSYYYYNERNYTSNFLKSSRYKGYSDYLTNEFFDFLSKYIIGYGEKPFRLLCISVFIISLFALIYMFTGLNTMDYGLVKINLSKNMYTFNEIIVYYLEAWYFSMITFSTVGYGEIIALGIFGKIFVCLEVFLGITVHATWTSVLFSRLIQ